MNRRLANRRGGRPWLSLALFSLLLLTVAGQAWSQCSITSGGYCSGTCPAGKTCKSDGKDSYSCSCQASGAGVSPLGSMLNASGGSISFDGSSLSVTGMTVGSVFDKYTQTYVLNDPIIGAQILYPTMQYTGLYDFNNGVTQFEYYDFHPAAGSLFEILKGSDVLLSASIDDTWFMLNTNSFSGNDLTNITYDPTANSQFLSQLLQYSSFAQPATVVTPSTDFLAGSANFTASYSTAATESAGECASTPEPGAWLLLAVGTVLIGGSSQVKRRWTPRVAAERR